MMNQIIPTLLLAVILMSTASFLKSLLMEPNQLKRFFIRMSLLLAIDAGFTLITDLLLTKDNYLDATVPFILLYGPVLYLSVTNSKAKKNHKLHISLHFIAPLAVWIWFLVVVISKDQSQYVLLTQAKNAAGIASIFFYAYVSLVKRNRIKQQFLSRRHYLIFSGILLFIAAMPLLLHLLHYPEAERGNLAIILIRIQLYGVMLAASVFILIAQFLSTRNGKKSEHTSPPLKNKAGYTRSGLEPKQLLMIFDRLSVQMQVHRSFLKPQLSLEVLAKKLKVPPHHLTQVLNTVAGKKYHDYIAELRINYAVELMQKSPGLSLEEVMTASGYNSKSTFHRQFKKITEKSPGEFMKEQLDDNPKASLGVYR
jgi:AraC-like DNA-binding protein